APRVPERVERARLDQRLYGALVAHHRVDLTQEVVEVGELPLLPARAYDRLHHPGADVTDRAEAEPHILADGGEPGPGGVDVRRQHPDPHAPAFGQVDR